MTKQTYDLIVIGAGPAGLAAAELAARTGASVALIEKKTAAIGGGLLSECLPSKALIHAASQPEASWGKVRNLMKLKISQAKTRPGNLESYRKMGIDVYFGTAQHLRGQQIKVGKRVLDYKKIIIASGSSPRIPGIVGLEKTGFETGKTIFRRARLPRSLAIIGGGFSGMELAFALKNLGVDVHVIDHNPRALRMIDKDAAQSVRSAAKAKGIKFHISTSVMSVKKSGRCKLLSMRRGNVHKQLRVGEILVAAGRQANIPKGLARRDVYVATKGIVVDENWRTSNENIYAVGGCTNFGREFTHIVSTAATQAVMHALYGVSPKQNLRNQPTVLFAEPEVAQVGPTVTELSKTRSDFHVHIISFAEIEGTAGEGREGSVKICVGPLGRILSATFIGENAGELAGYVSFALDEKFGLSEMANVPLPYATLSSGLKQLASQAYLEQMQQRQRWYRLHANWHRAEKQMQRSATNLAQRFKTAGQSIGLF